MLRFSSLPTRAAATLLAWAAGSLLGGASLWAASPQPTPTAEPLQKVVVALDALHAFVGNSENGQRWQTFLLTNTLSQELAKGERADPAVLATVISKYAADIPGLQLEPFQNVKAALGQWHTALALKQPPADLAALARNAASSMKPISPEQIAAAKQRLQAALANLDAMLRRSGPAVEAGWKKFLHWEDLQGQLSRPEPPNLALLTAIADRFSSNNNGLEMYQFSQARDALQNYVALSAIATDKGWMEQPGEQLEQLAKNLDAYAKDGSAGEQAIQIGRILGLLERTGQAPELVAGVRLRNSYPNIFASASQRFSAIGFEEEINQTQGLTDNILGTSIFGSALVQGRSTLSLIPSQHGAEFSILLNATAWSNSMGYNGPVTLHTTGITQMNVSRTLRMDAHGLTAAPATGTAATSTTIHSICARSNLVERIAWKKAGQQKPQGEAIASQHAIARAAAQLEERTSPQIADANERYQEKFVKPLMRRGEFPRALDFSSQPERFLMSMLQVNSSQLAAPTAPPPHDGEHDISLSAHESAFVNYGEAILGGYTLTDVHLVEIIRDDLKGEVPEELQITQDKEPWEITFARETPLRVDLNKDGLQAFVRASRFTRGEMPGGQVVTEPLEISAVYTIEKTPAGAKLIRQGEVEVKFLDRQRLGVAQIGLKTFIRRKFEAMFKPEFASDGLKMKGRWERAGTLPMRELQIHGPWILVGWDLPSPDDAAPVEPAKPVAEKPVAEKPVVEKPAE